MLTKACLPIDDFMMKFAIPQYHHINCARKAS